MKKVLVFLLITFILTGFAQTVFASISFPPRLPANSNWNFSVTLDSDVEEVFLDDKKIVTAYLTGPTVVKDPINGAFVLDAFVFDRILYISYMGLSQGTYEISSSGDEKVFVEVFEPMSSDIENDLTKKIDDAVAEDERIMAQINTLEQDLLKKNTEIQELKTLLEQTKNSLNETKTSLGEVDARQRNQSNDFSSDFADITERMNTVETEVFPEPIVLEETETESSGNIFTGLSTFARGNWLSLFLVLVVTIVIVVVVAKKTLFKTKSVYDDFDSSTGEDTIKPEPEEESDDDEESPEPDSKGKWAFKD